MRDDMFNWLLRKKRTTPVSQVHRETSHGAAEATALSSAPVVEAMEPARADSVEPATRRVESAPAPAAVIEVPQSAVEAKEPEPAEAVAGEATFSPVAEISEPVGQDNKLSAAVASNHGPQPRRPSTVPKSRPKPLLILEGSASEIELLAGLEIVEYSGRRARSGKLIGVRADGRRLLAKLEDAGRIRAYTLRRDGVYRLEGANDARAPVLELRAAP